jgi:thioredoxin-like negative regulator of GroEL
VHAAAPADAAPVAQDTAVAAHAEEIEGHLHDATEAISADKWADAKEAAEQVLALDPENERAGQLLEQAESEIVNQGHYEQFLTSVRKQDYRGVARYFEQIAPESVYRIKAQPQHDRLRDDYVDSVTGMARRLARHGQCDRLRRLVRDARGLWAKAGRAASQFECHHAVASNDPGGTHHGGHTGEETGSGDNPEGTGGQSGAAGKSVDDLIEEARAAAKATQFGRAMRLCEDALHRRHGDSEALMICAISACNLKNVSKAKRYIGQIAPDRQGMARQICLRNGVETQ